MRWFGGAGHEVVVGQYPKEEQQQLVVRSSYNVSESSFSSVMQDSSGAVHEGDYSDHNHQWALNPAAAAAFNYTTTPKSTGKISFFFSESSSEGDIPWFTCTKVSTLML